MAQLFVPHMRNFVVLAKDESEVEERFFVSSYSRVFICLPSTFLVDIEVLLFFSPLFGIRSDDRKGLSDPSWYTSKIHENIEQTRVYSTTLFWPIGV